MARDAAIEARLLRWAEYVSVGDGNGYASVSVLHENWSPPTPGQTPMPKVRHAAFDVMQTHRAIGRLPLKLSNAVVAHYVIKGSVDHQAELLQCAADTVHGRIERAHQLLAREFCNNHELV